MLQLSTPWISFPAGARLLRVSDVRCTGTLWLGNAAYMYLSVSFIQMLKALMPVAVFTTGCVFGIETFSAGTLFNMVRAACMPGLSTTAPLIQFVFMTFRSGPSIA